MTLYWFNLAVTFALFCGVCLRMLNTPHPGWCWKCATEFVLWTAAHIGIAIVVLLIFMDNITGPMKEPTLRYVVMKFFLAILFLYPWKPKVVGL